MKSFKLKKTSEEAAKISTSIDPELIQEVTFNYNRYFQTPVFNEIDPIHKHSLFVDFLNIKLKILGLKNNHTANHKYLMDRLQKHQWIKQKLLNKKLKDSSEEIQKEVPSIVEVPSSCVAGGQEQPVSLSLFPSAEDQRVKEETVDQLLQKLLSLSTVPEEDRDNTPPPHSEVREDHFSYFQYSSDTEDTSTISEEAISLSGNINLLGLNILDNLTDASSERSVSSDGSIKSLSSSKKKRKPKELKNHKF